MQECVFYFEVVNFRLTKINESLKLMSTLFNFAYPHILDSQCSDYVKFQAISAIKEALCREWPVLSAEEKASLKQFTLQHLISNQG